MKDYLKYIIIGLVFITAPFLQQLGVLSSSSIIVLGTVMFYSIVGIGLNVLLGYSGLISLGTAGFMGLGAYISAYLTSDLGLPFIVSLIISVSVPLLIGLVIGLISLRIEGYYLAIATLGVAEIFRQVFVELDFLTGGFSGKNASYPNFIFFQMNRTWSYILIAVFLVGILIITHNIVYSRSGRALLTMRGSEAAAQAMGIDLLKYRLLAFGIATLYAAIGGVLYVHFIRFAYPSGWNVNLSLQILAVIVIGGMRTINGPIIGSIIVFGVPELILKQLPVIGNIDGLAYIFTGILIIVVILFYPNGLIYLGHDIKKLWKKEKVHEQTLSSH
ncbi:branched-chain amino acid ABC transporter permease [Acidaminobacter sp. JC074]|uniref:branched-chain amino acid ABC transporter permease n=1 Tax=Acidaminobacter sp. JC074 TaxID=2530199 RepID=UPI001F0DE618|nr:branched-chain amino acid ABC transporter permease [Acidaminobacter sp. JC074]MCH4886024.1 branched-chain amino acid ABC transporter permease [Acidaminobacter sp. JC074]